MNGLLEQHVTVDLDRPDANTFAYGNFVFEDKDLQRP